MSNSSWPDEAWHGSADEPSGTDGRSDDPFEAPGNEPFSFDNSSPLFDGVASPRPDRADPSGFDEGFAPASGAGFEFPRSDADDQSESRQADQGAASFAEEPASLEWPSLWQPPMPEPPSLEPEALGAWADDDGPFEGRTSDEATGDEATGDDVDEDEGEEEGQANWDSNETNRDPNASFWHELADDDMMADAPSASSALLPGAPAGSEFEVEDFGLSCPACATTWKHIRFDGRVGCSSCYSVFREPLRAVFDRVQREARHTGKKPRAAFKRHLRLKTLRQRRDNQLQVLGERLKDAVREERYEEAARLRDRIKMVRSTIVTAPDF